MARQERAADNSKMKLKQISISNAPSPIRVDSCIQNFSRSLRITVTDKFIPLEERAAFSDPTLQQLAVFLDSFQSQLRFELPFFQPSSSAADGEQQFARLTQGDAARLRLFPSEKELVISVASVLRVDLVRSLCIVRSHAWYKWFRLSSWQQSPKTFMSQHLAATQPNLISIMRFFLDERVASWELIQWLLATDLDALWITHGLGGESGSLSSGLGSALMSLQQKLVKESVLSVLQLVRLRASETAPPPSYHSDAAPVAWTNMLLREQIALLESGLLLLARKSVLSTLDAREGLKQLIAMQFGSVQTNTAIFDAESLVLRDRLVLTSLTVAIRLLDLNSLFALQSLPPEPVNAEEYLYFPIFSHPAAVLEIDALLKPLSADPAHALLWMVWYLYLARMRTLILRSMQLDHVRSTLLDSDADETNDMSAQQQRSSAAHLAVLADWLYSVNAENEPAVFRFYLNRFDGARPLDFLSSYLRTRTLSPSESVGPLVGETWYFVLAMFLFQESICSSFDSTDQTFHHRWFQRDIATVLGTLTGLFEAHRDLVFLHAAHVDTAGQRREGEDAFKVYHQLLRYAPIHPNELYFRFISSILRAGCNVDHVTVTQSAGTSNMGTSGNSNQHHQAHYQDIPLKYEDPNEYGILGKDPRKHHERPSALLAAASVSTHPTIGLQLALSILAQSNILFEVIDDEVIANELEYNLDTDTGVGQLSAREQRTVPFFLSRVTVGPQDHGIIDPQKDTAVWMLEGRISMLGLVRQILDIFIDVKSLYRSGVFDQGETANLGSFPASLLGGHGASLEVTVANSLQLVRLLLAESISNIELLFRRAAVDPDSILVVKDETWPESFMGFSDPYAWLARVTSNILLHALSQEAAMPELVTAALDMWTFLGARAHDRIEIWGEVDHVLEQTHAGVTWDADENWMLLRRLHQILHSHERPLGRFDTTLSFLQLTGHLAAVCVQSHLEPSTSQLLRQVSILRTFTNYTRDILLANLFDWHFDDHCQLIDMAHAIISNYLLVLEPRHNSHLAIVQMDLVQHYVDGSPYQIQPVISLIQTLVRFLDGIAHDVSFDSPASFVARRPALAGDGVSTSSATSTAAGIRSRWLPISSSSSSSSTANASSNLASSTSAGVGTFPFMNCNQRLRIQSIQMTCHLFLRWLDLLLAKQRLFYFDQIERETRHPDGTDGTNAAGSSLRSSRGGVVSIMTNTSFFLSARNADGSNKATFAYPITPLEALLLGADDSLGEKPHVGALAACMAYPWLQSFHFSLIHLLQRLLTAAGGDDKKESAANAPSSHSSSSSSSSSFSSSSSSSSSSSTTTTSWASRVDTLLGETLAGRDMVFSTNLLAHVVASRRHTTPFASTALSFVAALVSAKHSLAGKILKDAKVIWHDVALSSAAGAVACGGSTTMNDQVHYALKLNLNQEPALVCAALEVLVSLWEQRAVFDEMVSNIHTNEILWKNLATIVAYRYQLDNTQMDRFEEKVELLMPRGRLFQPLFKVRCLVNSGLRVRSGLASSTSSSSSSSSSSSAGGTTDSKGASGASGSKDISGIFANYCMRRLAQAHALNLLTVVIHEYGLADPRYVQPIKQLIVSVLDKASSREHVSYHSAVGSRIASPLVAETQELLELFVREQQLHPSHSRNVRGYQDPFGTSFEYDLDLLAKQLFLPDLLSSSSSNADGNERTRAFYMDAHGASDYSSRRYFLLEVVRHNLAASCVTAELRHLASWVQCLAMIITRLKDSDEAGAGAFTSGNVLAGILCSLAEEFMHESEISPLADAKLQFIAPLLSILMKRLVSPDYMSGLEPKVLPLLLNCISFYIRRHGGQVFADDVVSNTGLYPTPLASSSSSSSSYSSSFRKSSPFHQRNKSTPGASSSAPLSSSPSGIPSSSSSSSFATMATGGAASLVPLAGLNMAVLRALCTSVVLPLDLIRKEMSEQQEKGETLLLEPAMVRLLDDCMFPIRLFCIFISTHADQFLHLPIVPYESLFSMLQITDESKDHVVVALCAMERIMNFVQFLSGEQYSARLSMLTEVGIFSALVRMLRTATIGAQAHSSRIGWIHAQSLLHFILSLIKLPQIAEELVSVGLMDYLIDHEFSYDLQEGHVEPFVLLGAGSDHSNHNNNNDNNNNNNNNNNKANLHGGGGGGGGGGIRGENRLVRNGRHVIWCLQLRVVTLLLAHLNLQDHFRAQLVSFFNIYRRQMEGALLAIVGGTQDSITLPHLEEATAVMALYARALPLFAQLGLEIDRYLIGRLSLLTVHSLNALVRNEMELQRVMRLSYRNRGIVLPPSELHPVGFSRSNVGMSAKLATRASASAPTADAATLGSATSQPFASFELMLDQAADMTLFLVSDSLSVLQTVTGAQYMVSKTSGPWQPLELLFLSGESVTTRRPDTMSSSSSAIIEIKNGGGAIDHGGIVGGGGGSGGEVTLAYFWMLMELAQFCERSIWARRDQEIPLHLFSACVSIIEHAVLLIVAQASLTLSIDQSLMRAQQHQHAFLASSLSSSSSSNAAASAGAAAGQGAGYYGADMMGSGTMGADRWRDALHANQHQHQNALQRNPYRRGLSNAERSQMRHTVSNDVLVFLAKYSNSSMAQEDYLRTATGATSDEPGQRLQALRNTGMFLAALHSFVEQQLAGDGDK